MALPLKRYRSFKIRYLAATDKRPSRIKIVDCWYGDSITIPYETSDILDDAQSALGLLGFDIVSMASSGARNGEYDLLLCENFELRMK